MKFVDILKTIFVKNFWIKAVCFVLAFLAALSLNIG